jgi:succinate-semialdehyde dehydrogenase/glutarate-semialdehyde dehydrogenase
MLNLNDPTLLETRAYINGNWVESGTTFSVDNPANGEKRADVTDLGVEDVSLAIDGAYAIQKEWAAKSAKERGTA